MSALAAALLFIVYLNVPAIIVREYGFPFMVGAAIPLLLLIPIANVVLLRGEPLRLPRVVLAAAILLIVHTLSAFNALYPNDSLSVVVDWALEGVLLMALIVNAFRSRADVMAAANAVIAAGALMGAIVLAQQLTGATDHNLFGFGQLDAEIVDGSGETQRRLAGPIGETNRFAQVLAVLLPIAAALAVVSRGATSLAYGIAAGLIAGGMSLAFSRGVIVALVLATPFALLFRIVRLRHIAIGALAALLLLTALPHYRERVVSIGEVALQSIGLTPGGLRNADGAARGRVTEMKATGLLFMDYPLLGAGPGMAEVHYADYAPIVGGKVRPGARESHNLYLQLAAETGIIGLVTFFAVVIFTFSGLERARRRFADRDLPLWALVCGMELALIVYLTTSLFLHAAYVRYFWLLLGLCVVVSSVERTPVLIRLIGQMLTQTARQVRAHQ